MKGPTISVIVPVYNTELYLRECVDSILAQTYQNFELILVNDGSTDGSPGICDQYASQDNRVYVIHQTNQGQAAARNHAVIQATGEWICFVDSDDLIHPQMLQLLYHAATKGLCDISMCGYVESEHIPESFFLWYDYQFDTMELNEKKLVELYNNNQYPSWVACFKLIRKNIVLKNPFTEGRIYEDNAVVCKWVYEAESVAIVPHKLYFYRVNPAGTTKKGFNLKKLDYLWALQEIIDFLGHVHYEELRKIFCEMYILAAAGFYRTIIMDLGRRDIARKIRYDLLTMFVRNRKTIKLSQNRMAEVIGNLWPKAMPLYWLMVGMSSTIQQGGIRVLLSKIIGHLR